MRIMMWPQPDAHGKVGEARLPTLENINRPEWALDRDSLASVPEASSRLVLVDLARVLAMLFMIQGHSLDVLLAPEYRQGPLFAVWLFLRGLTAPTFFMLSGVSFLLATARNWDRYSRLSGKTLRRLGRFFFFVALGYVMHLPAATLSGFQYVDPVAWKSWFQVDVLQCIGLTLVALQVLALCADSPARLARWSACAGGAIILLTPLAWTAGWTDSLPVGISSYFSSKTGSYFPLFPWAGYVLFGVGLGYRLSQWSAATRHLIGRLAASAALLGAAGLVLIQPMRLLYPQVDFWTTSPSLFLVRAACVCVLLAGFAYLTAACHIPQGVFRAVAQESLLVYFVHLCILYGSIWNSGLRQNIGATLTPLPTFGSILLLIVAMMLMAWSWNWLKRNEPRHSYILRFGIVLLAVYHSWAA